jgi:hypothetical protein
MRIATGVLRVFRLVVLVWMIMEQLILEFIILIYSEQRHYIQVDPTSAIPR